MKKKELAVFLILLLICGGIWMYFNMSGKDNHGEVNVTVRGTLYGTYSLGKDQTIQIEDTNTLEIKDGQAYISSATCPDHICMEFNPITDRGGIIVCLPNSVYVEGVTDNQDL